MEVKLSVYLAWFCCVKLEGNDQMYKYKETITWWENYI